MTRLSTMAVAAGIALASGAQAQDISTELPPEDRWTVTVAPYLWMLSLDGNTTVGGIKADVDVPFKDSIQDLSVGGMLLTTVRKGKLGFSINGVYTRVSPDNSVGPLDIDSTADLASLFGGPFYRMVEWQYGETSAGQPLRFYLEPYVGARLNYLRVEVEVRGGQQQDESQTWVDPIVGSRVGLDLTDRLALFGGADVGGVVTGSDFAWNAQAYLGYQTSVFGRETFLSFGFRAYHADYEDGNFKWDATQYGPIIGTAIKF